MSSPCLSRFGWLNKVSPLLLTIATSVTISHGVTVRSALHWLEDTNVDIFKIRRQFSAKFLERCLRKPSQSTFLISPHKNKLGDVRSGEQGGYSNGPPRPIHLSLNFKFRISRTMSAKCGGAPSCRSHILCLVAMLTFLL